MPVRVIPYLDPRVALLAAPQVNSSVQDLSDDLKDWEDEPAFLSYPILIRTAGKEDLGGGVNVGITATLQNTIVGFEQRGISVSSGTVTTPDSNGKILTDSGATFITDGVIPGASVINFTDTSVGTVIEVVSETELRLLEPLEDGTDNQFDSADSYKIWNIIQCEIDGGNLVAIDDVDTPISSILPTFGTQIVRTSSSSATLTESEAIEYASFDDRVTVDINGEAGTTGLIGSKQRPVNNIPDALIIAATRGFTKIHVHDDWVFPAGTFINDLTVEGDQSSLFTFDSGAVLLNCIVQNVSCTGDITGIIGFKNCELSDIGSSNPTPSSQPVLIENCFIEGDLFLPSAYSGTLTVSNSSAREDAGGFPVVDLGGSTAQLFVSNFTGEFSIKGGTANNNVIIDLISGRVILESTITNGTYTIRGVGSLVNDSSIVPNINGLIDARDIKNVKVAVETLRSHHTGYGNTFYWDPINGNDSNDGKSEETATLTFAQAHTLAEDGNHDVIIGIAGQSGGQTVSTEVISITKDYLFVRGPGRDFKIKPTSTTSPTVTIDAIGVELSGFIVETAATGTQHGIQVNANADFFFLDSMWIHFTTDDGVRVTGSNVYGRIQNTFMSHLGSDGVHIEGEVRHLKMSKVEIDDAGANGVNISGTTPRNNLITEGVQIYDSGEYGIKIGTGGLRNFVGHGVSIYDNALGNIDDQGTKTFIADHEESEELVDLIWDEQTAGHNIVGSYGLIIEELHRFEGLDLGNPVTHDDGSIEAGGVTLDVTCNPDDSVTIERQP